MSSPGDGRVPVHACFLPDDKDAYFDQDLKGVKDYVDGTLASEDERRVASHVASCARCQAMVTDFTTLRTAVHGLEPATPADTLAGRREVRLSRSLALGHTLSRERA